MSLQTALLGDLNKMPLERKVLNATLLTSWVICALIFIELLMLTASWSSITLATVAGLFYLYLHAVALKRPAADWLVWPFLLSQYVIIFTDWIFIGGNTGIALPLLLTLGAIMPIITRHDQLVRGYLSLALVFALLVFCAALFAPHLPQEPFSLGRLWEQLLETAFLVVGLGLVTYLAISTLRSQHRKIELLNRELDRMAHMDGLTQVANRRQFDQRLELEWKRHQRHSSTLSLIMCDIDHFKQFNDCFGHLVGDDCIKTISKLIQQVVKRPTDLVARYGGDEFVILLPETELHGARQLAREIDAAVRKAQIQHGTLLKGTVVTVSTGTYATVPTMEVTPEFLIECADRALYAAKQVRENPVGYPLPETALGVSLP